MAIDPRKYGPTRRELWVRLGMSIFGLAFLAAIWARHGTPSGPAMFEVFGFGGLFLGGSAVWALRRLMLRLHP